MGESVWFFDGNSTRDIGLTDSEHTRADGFKQSSFQTPLTNSTSSVIGNSNRYIGSTAAGQSAWYFNGTSTVKVGMMGAEYTRFDGYQHHLVFSLRSNGTALGSSERYNNGQAVAGYTAWFYNGVVQTEIGLGPNQSSTIRSNNSINQAVGNSSDVGGQRAWLFNGLNTVDISLIDAEHTSASGSVRNDAIRINSQGKALGSAQRYLGTFDLKGQTAWYYDGIGTRNIGMVDAAHTSNDGNRFNVPLRLNNNGNAIGYANKYRPNDTASRTAWYFDGTTTHAMGFTDSTHTGSNNYQWSFSDKLNNSGKAIGYSVRFGGQPYTLGQTAWIYDGVSTTDIGLTDGQHVFNDSFGSGRESTATHINDAGLVIGYANRYNGTYSDLGRSAWLYDGSTTNNISLVDAIHTRLDGYRYSTATQLSENSQVVGYSTRYSGSNANGQTAWFFDPALGTTIEFVLSQRTSDGYAWSSANYLGEDGIVLGTYTLFDSLDVSLGNRAFFFSLTGGLHDLGGLVSGGLSASDWAMLASAIRSNGIGHIIGNGKDLNEPLGQMGYLLTPNSVPEPSSIYMASTLALFGLLRRKRKQATT